MPGSPWFVSVRRNPQSRLRLFCFPCAGRGASLFRTWRDQLPAFEVWPIEYPGHETRFRERLIRNIDVLVDELVEAISPQISVPFAFYGHSLGGIVAYETARRLGDRYGIEPERLLVSSVRAPHLPLMRREIRDLPDREFRQELRAFGTREEVLANEELMQLMSPMLRADFCMFETYAHRPRPPLATPITAFGGITDATVPWHRLQEWSTQTRSEFRLHLLPGGHFFIDTAQAPLMNLLREELPSGGRGNAPKRADVLPGRDEIHLWRVGIAGLPPGAVARLNELLAPDEMRRAMAFLREEDRVRHIFTRATLRLILARYIGQSPAQVRFGYGPQGKPFLQNPPADVELGFNVAHSGDLALIAVSRGRAVGVDVEQIVSDRDLGEMDIVFTAQERQYLRSVAANERQSVFYDLWTRKEAYLKRSGLGLSGCPELVDVLPSDYYPQPPQSSQVRRADGFLASLSPADGYAGAVACEGHCSSILCREPILTEESEHDAKS